MKQDKRLYWLFAIYLIFTAILVILHEPWRDEAQAWLLARDHTLTSLLHHMSYEGTPPLWHLILMPFAKLGAPFATMKFIHWAMAGVTFGLFFFRSSLSLLEKTLFLFGYYALFEYNIVARNYLVTFLLLMLWVQLLPHRKTLWGAFGYASLIFLLGFASVHSLVVALALWGEWAFDLLFKKEGDAKRWLAWGLTTVGLAGIFWMMLPKPDHISMPLKYMTAHHNAIRAIGFSLFPGVSYGIPKITAAIAAAIYLVWGRFVFLNRKHWLFFLGAPIGLLLLFVLIYPGDFRHHGFVFMLMFIWYGFFLDRSVWKMRKGKLFFKRALIGLLVVSNGFALFASFGELFYAFSGSKHAAEFLATFDAKEGTVYTAHQSVYAEGILPYLPEMKIYYADHDRVGTYIQYHHDRRNPDISFVEALGRAESRFPASVRVHILTEKQDSPHLKLIYQTPAELFLPGFGHGKWERYFIYEETPKSPSNSPHST